MFDFPPDTPWIYAWLGAAALLGVIIGWLLGRIGKRRLRRERNGLRSEIDDALEGRRASDEATANSGALAAELQKRLDDTTTSLGDAEREIDRLRKEVEEAENRVAELETEVGSPDGANNEEIDLLLSRLVTANEETDSLRAALSAATVDTDARVSAAESEAQQALSRAAQLEDALAAARSESDELRAELAAALASDSDGSPDGDLVGSLRRQIADEQQDAAEAATALEAVEARLQAAETRAEVAEAALAAGGESGDPGFDGEGEIAARDHLVKELQAKVSILSDVDDRLKAREAELGELRRGQGAVVAAKDAEIRALQERLEASQTRPDPGLQAALDDARAQLAAVEEKARHWEQEAAGLRDAQASAPEVAAPEPTAAPIASTAPMGIEERLDRLQETLADKEARIAYLADRVARLESTVAVPRRTAESAQPESAPATASPTPETPVAEAVAPQEPDDLTQIWGIGPAIQRKLNSVGITTFEQIAVLPASERKRLGDMLGDFLDRFEADDWVGQARGLIEERGGVVPDAPLKPIRLTPPPAAVAPDDLTEIKGIGPFIQTTLNGLGVNTFAQIAAWDDADVERFGEALVIFQGRIAREGWVDQARRLMRRR